MSAVPQWSEYEWEREIKRDEMRINGYFKALPRYLDLPGEDEAIYDKLQAQKELAPVHGGDWQWPPAWSDGADDGFDDRGEAGEEEVIAGLISNTGFDFFQQLEHAVREWNVWSALHLEVCPALEIAAVYGKILSRVYNFVELGDNPEYGALKRSLMRRALADFNALFGRLAEVKKVHPEAGALVAAAQHLRERALKLMFDQR